MKVQANFDYKDLQLNRIVKKDEVIEVEEERAKELIEKTFNGVPFGKVVEEIQEEPVKRTRRKKAE